jgi:hypothetical protein
MWLRASAEGFVRTDSSLALVVHPLRSTSTTTSFLYISGSL